MKQTCDRFDCKNGLKLRALGTPNGARTSPLASFEARLLTDNDTPFNAY
jgi:hypothetical protein